MRKKRTTFRLLIRKPEEKRLQRRTRRRWAFSIKMDCVEIGWGGVDWIGSGYE
jgi:hypothetical protein